MRRLLLLILLLLPSLAWGADYHIGAGQAHTTINAFDWFSLNPGDHVYIHPGTYKEMILLSRSGTAENPIVIEGVPDGSGNLPVLDGNGMVMPSQYDGHLSEYDLGGGKLAQGYGMIFFHRSLVNQNFGVQPEHIVVRNLEIKATTPELYTFTNTNGAVQSYPDSNAGVYIKTGSNILLENLVIHDTANGVELQGVDVMSRNITLRGSHIYDVGRTDGRKYLEHGAYMEASGMIYEYNIIGPMRDGTENSTIKDRGAGTVIRYNILYSGARNLDLVEPENQSSWNCDGTVKTNGKMHDEPGFGESFVYGNVFINRKVGTKPFSAYPIHYGYDNCPAASRSGTLYFYNNTVIHDIPQSVFFNSSIFDLAPAGTVSAYNNVIASLQDTALSLGFHSKTNVPYAVGTFNWLGGNWITSGYTNFRPSYTGTWNETVPILTGPNTGVLTNPSADNASVPSGSPLIGAAVLLPAEITAAHNVEREYVSVRSFQARAGLTDIGAFDYTGVAVCNDMDADGYGSPASNLCTHAALDCNDASASIHPGAVDTPGNGIDEDCSGADATASPTCSDGIQNQEETGVDCGGPCSACPPTPGNGRATRGNGKLTLSGAGSLRMIQ